MIKNTSAGTALLTAALLVAGMSSAACNRGAEETVPVAERQTQTPVQPAETPIATTGCIRAGEAGGTFVLTSSGEEDGRTVTYALNYPEGTTPDELREHIGQRAAVEGIVRSHQAVAGATPSMPAANEPVGTAGQPSVQTQTELAVQQLQVTSLRPLGEACGDDR